MLTTHERHFELQGSYLKEKKFLKDNNDMRIVDDKIYHVIYFEEADKFVIKPKVEVLENSNGVHK